MPSPLKPAPRAMTTLPSDAMLTVLPLAIPVEEVALVASGAIVASGVDIAISVDISVAAVVGTIATSTVAASVAAAAIVASAVEAAVGGIRTVSMTWITPFDA